MWLLAMSLLFCAALTKARRLRRGGTSPAAGQPIEEFEAANDAELTATPSATRLASALQKCPLKPPPFGSTEAFHKGAHAIATVTRRKIMGCASAKSPSGKNFVQPDFHG